MRRLFTLSAFVVSLVVFLAFPLHAQRGGRGRGMDESLTNTSFESPDKALAFQVPPDVTLFTPESPGSFRQVFKSGYMAYLINLVGGEVTVETAEGEGFTLTVEVPA